MCPHDARVTTLAGLAPGEYTSCPIAMEEFDKVQVSELLPLASGMGSCSSCCNCFVLDRPEYCVGRLPCGHHFHPVAVLCHMVVNGMKCPVCRWGSICH